MVGTSLVGGFLALFLAFGIFCLEILLGGDSSVRGPWVECGILSSWAKSFCALVRS